MELGFLPLADPERNNATGDEPFLCPPHPVCLPVGDGGRGRTFCIEADPK